MFLVYLVSKKLRQFVFVLDRRMSEIVSGQVSFGLIPPEHWYQPSWIDERKAQEGRERLIEANVIYGGASHTKTF